LIHHGTFACSEDSAIMLGPNRGGVVACGEDPPSLSMNWFSGTRMIVYEVNIKVREAVADDYRAWLGDHMRELLTLPGFLSAEVLIVEPEAATPEHQEIVVHYRMESHHALMLYLRDHAPRMRAKAGERFAGQFEIHRRVLAPLVEMLPV
jgi:hypothetical protein